MAAMKFLVCILAITQVAATVTEFLSERSLAAEEEAEKVEKEAEKEAVTEFLSAEKEAENMYSEGANKKQKAEDVATYEVFLDAVFTASLRMMLPDSEDKLGAHCFRYAAMMAGEYYFPKSAASEGPKDILTKFWSSSHKLATFAKNEFQNLPSSRAKLGDFLKTVSKYTRELDVAVFDGNAHQIYDQRLSYGLYLGAIFDAVTLMMPPTRVYDLGQHCFGYAFVLAQEFYFGERPGPDQLGLVTSSSTDATLTAAREEVNKDWNGVSKSTVGGKEQVSRDAFKAYFVEKAFPK